MIVEIYLGAKAALYLGLFTRWNKKSLLARKGRRLEHLRAIGKVCTWESVQSRDLDGAKLFAITFGYGIEFWVLPAHAQPDVDAAAQVIKNGLCVDPPPPLDTHRPTRGEEMYAPPKPVREAAGPQK